MKVSNIGKIQNVGLLIEQENLSFVKVILDKLIANGIEEENISILVYVKNFNPKESVSLPTFGLREVKCNGNFYDGIVAKFVETNFDILISYFSVENPILLSITKRSRANFKAGFVFENYFFNDINIKIKESNAAVFTEELLKYLKNLNKI